MKKIDAGQTIAILANVGVLVGIVFLAIEIRQSNVQTRVVNQTAIVGQTISLQASIANDADSSSIYFRGMNSYADLSAEDKMRFDLMMQALLGRHAASMGADGAGLGVDATNYIGRNIAIYFEYEGFRQWWAEMDRRSLPRPLVRFIDAVEEYVAAKGP
jgi:hypothetical protein